MHTNKMLLKHIDRIKCNIKWLLPTWHQLSQQCLIEWREYDINNQLLNCQDKYSLNSNISESTNLLKIIHIDAIDVHKF